jgi:hypothetical protein
MPRLWGDEADSVPNPFRIEIPRHVLPLLAQLEETRRPIQLDRTEDGWLATFERADEVVFLDDHLKRQRRISVALPVESYVRPEVGVDPNGRFLVVSYRTAICGYALPSGDGHARLLWKSDQEPWSSFEGTSCAVDGQSRLWWIRRDSGQKELVTISAIETGTTLAEAELAESYDCHYGIVLNPDGDSAMLDGGAGQDGSFLWKVVFRAGRLSMQALSTDDRVMGGFSPDGIRFVTAPHNIGAISIQRWSDCAVIDRLPGERVFIDEDSEEAACDHFDVQATFFGGQRVIANTRQNRLLLLRTDPLRVEAELWPQGSPIYGYGDRGQRVHDARAAVDFERDLRGGLVARNKLLAGHRGGGLSVWDLSGLGDAQTPNERPMPDAAL